MPLTEVDAARLNDNVFNTVGPFTNRIINGDMRIDQRNAGAAQASTTYGLDRWYQEWSSTGVTLSFQQVTDAPTAFTNSLKVTVSTGNVSFTNSAAISQAIEGFNCSDFNFGTASARPITISFWVKSSITGSFGGVLRNGDFAQTYPFAYTINYANTWEYKTVTIPGSTTGTWSKNNTGGLWLFFGLGAVAGRKATANVWAPSIARQPNGTVDLIATTGATWQVTGVQLEAGSVATPFERRSYGTELALCQRYYQTIGEIVGNGSAASTPNTALTWQFTTTMRGASTVTFIQGQGSATTAFPSNNYCVFLGTSAADAAARLGVNTATASAEL